MWDDSTRLIVDVGGCERKMWNLAGAKSFHFFRDFATHRVTHFDVITFSLSCWGGPCALCTYSCKTLLSYVRVESFFFIKSIHATKICQFGMIYFKYKLSLSIMIPYKIHIYSWTMVSLYLYIFFCTKRVWTSSAFCLPCIFATYFCHNGCELWPGIQAYCRLCEMWHLYSKVLFRICERAAVQLIVTDTCIETGKW